MFSNFMNVKRDAPTYIAAYIDSFMTKGVVGKNPEAVSKQLEAIVKLSNYLLDRDVFFRFLEQHLAIRLLNKTIANLEAEEELIKRI